MRVTKSTKRITRQQACRLLAFTVQSQQTNQITFFCLPISGVAFAVGSGSALLGGDGDRITRL
jgi:hypothetical protein